MRRRSEAHDVVIGVQNGRAALALRVAVVHQQAREVLVSRGVAKLDELHDTELATATDLLRLRKCVGTLSIGSARSSGSEARSAGQTSIIRERRLR